MSKHCDTFLRLYYLKQLKIVQYIDETGTDIDPCPLQGGYSNWVGLLYPIFEDDLRSLRPKTDQEVNTWERGSLC